MSTYGVVITECPEQEHLVGRFYWDGKNQVFHWDTLEEARDNSNPAGRTKYAPVLITPALCKQLRKDPSAKYLGPVIE